MTSVAAEAPIVCSETRVVAADRVGESFVRLVLAGPELWSWSADVVDSGTVSDAYIKLLVPPPGPPTFGDGSPCPSPNAGGCARTRSGEQIPWRWTAPRCQR